MDRRHFITTSSFFSLSLLLTRCNVAAADDRPSLYVTASKTGSLRTLDEVRAAITEGHASSLWARILEKAHADLGAPPLTPASMVPGRMQVMADQKNPDFVICEAAGQRILRAALVHLLSGEDGHKETAMRQMTSLFDDADWPQWLDQAHHRFELPAGLRTGMLAKDVGFAFDWLYPSLTEAERRFIVEGLDRKAIQPFLISVEKDAWWMRDKNNWLTTIAGGVGIAAMALKEHHPQSQEVLDIAIPAMEGYMSIYGEEGEFNESIAYANATERPVNFFGAYRYASRGGANKLAQPPFPDTCQWLMYLTVPPGRSAAFGDGHAHAKPWINYFAAVASASQDGLLQWFYLQHAQDTADPLELLWYDASVEPIDPQGRLPLGRVFPAHGGCICSRTDWNQESTPCVVYGKFGREENHEHHDIGQLCIDGFGKRLIVDPGSPSSYPVDFFEEQRWAYYNASVRGHNVFMFGDREMRAPEKLRGAESKRDLASISGRLIASDFDDEKGGYWKIDLTNAYESVRSVTRTVVHLLPGIVAVLDEAELESVENISMRWHTHEAVESDTQGRFSFDYAPARLSGLVTRLDGDIELLGGHHRYEPPFHLSRTGDPLEQRHEPFIEAFAQDRRCRLLSLFSVSHNSTPASRWNRAGNGWSIETENGVVEVTLGEKLRVANGDRVWEV